MNNKQEKMAALLLLDKTCKKHLHAIRQLNLTDWLTLAADLGVEQNNRNHAAKKLALRELGY